MKYKIKIHASDIHQLRAITTHHVNNHDGFLIFETNQKGYLHLKENLEAEKMEVLNMHRQKRNKLLDRYLITMIGMLFFLLFLINQSYTVTSVVFTNYNTYNVEIEKSVDQYFRKVGPFRYLNKDLNDINLELKSKFYEYEWIGVRKKGTILYLDIKILNDEIPPNNDSTPGSIYAKYEGIVKMYHVENGIVVVQEEQYIMQGDLLISGDIIHYGDIPEKSKAKGFVIAEVLEYQEFIIPKKEVQKIRTGRLEKNQNISFFKGNGKNESKFTEYETEYEAPFLIKGMLKMNRYYNYEIKEVETYYTKEDAIRYGISKIYNQFKLNKKNEYEKIIFCNNINVEEEDSYYKLKYLVKTYKNIGEFVPNT